LKEGVARAITDPSFVQAKIVATCNQPFSTDDLAITIIPVGFDALKCWVARRIAKKVIRCASPQTIGGCSGFATIATIIFREKTIVRFITKSISEPTLGATATFAIHERALFADDLTIPAVERSVFTREDCVAIPISNESLTNTSICTIWHVPFWTTDRTVALVPVEFFTCVLVIAPIIAQPGFFCAFDTACRAVLFFANHRAVAPIQFRRGTIQFFVTVAVSDHGRIDAFLIAIQYLLIRATIPAIPVPLCTCQIGITRAITLRVPVYANPIAVKVIPRLTDAFVAAFEIGAIADSAVDRDIQVTARAGFITCL